MGAQCECIAFQVGCITVRVVIACHPSAVESKSLAGSIMAEAVLHHDPASIHIVGHVIAESIRVEKGTIAERHNDLILLKLTQSRSSIQCVKQVNRDYIGLCLDFRLKLSRHAVAI